MFFLKKKLTLITWRKPHDDNVLCIYIVRFARKNLHGLVVDDAGIGVVNGTMTAEQQLWVLLFSKIGRPLFEEVAELIIGVDNIWNTFEHEN